MPLPRAFLEQNSRKWSSIVAQHCDFYLQSDLLTLESLLLVLFLMYFFFSKMPTLVNTIWHNIKSFRRIAFIIAHTRCTAQDITHGLVTLQCPQCSESKENSLFSSTVKIQYYSWGYLSGPNQMQTVARHFYTSWRTKKQHILSHMSFCCVLCQQSGKVIKLYVKYCVQMSHTVGWTLNYEPLFISGTWLIAKNSGS